MADNFTFTEGTGKTGASKDVSDVHYIRHQVVHGESGEAIDVSRASGMPVGGARLEALETIVSKAYSFFTSSYQDLSLTNVSTSTHVFVVNMTDCDIALSQDAGSHMHHVVPAFSARPVRLKEGTTAVYAKYLAAPTVGTCYFEGMQG